MVGNNKGCEEGVNANVALYTLVYPRRGHSSISSVHPVDPEAPMVVIGISDVIVVFLLHKIFISFRIITAVCIMIDRSQKLVECDFPSPLTGFNGFE